MNGRYLVFEDILKDFFFDIQRDLRKRDKVLFYKKEKQTIFFFSNVNREW